MTVRKSLSAQESLGIVDYLSIVPRSAINEEERASYGRLYDQIKEIAAQHSVVLVMPVRRQHLPLNFLGFGENMEQFEKELEELLMKYSMRLFARVEVDVRHPHNESFTPADPAQRSNVQLQAEREIHPIELNIRVRVEKLGPWHHVSGDDRKLHPTLRTNCKQ